MSITTTRWQRAALRVASYEAGLRTGIMTMPSLPNYDPAWPRGRRDKWLELCARILELEHDNQAYAAEAASQ